MMHDGMGVMMGGLLPVSRTRSMGVIVKPEVAYGEAEFQS